MDEIICADKRIPVDDEGFLVDRNDWSDEIASALAQREGIGDLDDEQLAIIRFMRDYYLKFHAFPILSHVCKTIDQPRSCVNDEFVNPLTAWKIAGLPKLDGIHFVSVDGERYILEECC